jgi:hypothetical protein
LLASGQLERCDRDARFAARAMMLGAIESGTAAVGASDRRLDFERAKRPQLPGVIDELVFREEFRSQ